MDNEYKGIRWIACLILLGAVVAVPVPSATAQPQLNKPIVGIAPWPKPTGRGYWLAGADGGIFNFGDAGYYDSLPGRGITPNGGVVGIAATPTGRGYWLAGADGGIFTFGDAGYYRSLPEQGIKPNGGVVGIAATPTGRGYWLAGADGGVFSFGDAMADVIGSAAGRSVLGKSIYAQPVRGVVLISLPGRRTRASASSPGLKGRAFIPLREPRTLPIGTLFDTRRGAVKLTSARDTKGATQSGQFVSGVFQVLQSRKKRAKGLTELRLKGANFRNCASRRQGKRTAAGAEASRRLSRRTIRRLRGRGQGRFRTRGRYSAATVRGTDWTVFDRCDGTLTKVKRGRVSVRDFRRRKTISVGAGKRYLARAPK